MMKKKLAGYEIEGTLGEGGMGVVYRARDITLDRPVAIKVIRPETFGSEGRERFLREARACSRINHPNIVTVYAAGEEGGRPYMAMELLEGQTLREVIDAGPVPWEKALDWMVGILDALGRLHQEGIIHRDLKPENIMVTTDGVVKLMDFGVAHLASSSTLTREGATVGTVFYMSPEQVQGDKVDSRSDIFSMGIILYQMLTGVLPFRGEHPMAVMYSISNEPPRPLRDSSGTFPAGLEAIINRVLEKTPADRFPDAASFRDALLGLLKEGGPPGARFLTADRRRRFLLGSLASAAVVLALIILVFAPIFRGRGAGRNRELAIHHNELGQNYELDGKITEAQGEYRKAILADPQYATPWNNLAVLAIRGGNLAEADSLLRRAISIKPDHAVALFNLGTVREDRGDLEGAEKFYRASIEADSSFLQGYSNLGALLLAIGNIEEAKEVLDSGLFKEPTHPFLLKNRGEVSLRLGRGEEALRYWIRALKILPASSELHRLLARWYEQKGRYKEAKVHWQAVSEFGSEEERQEALEALEQLRSRR